MKRGYITAAIATVLMAGQWACQQSKQTSSREGQQPSGEQQTHKQMQMPIPIGEFKSWRHVKTMVIHDTAHPLYNPFGGVHHVYASEKAEGALEPCESRRFPDGSVLAFVLYEHVVEGGAIHEGALKLYAFMEKDASRYASTAGWGFYAYDASGKAIVTPDNAQGCFSCHSQAASRDYVFSCLTE